MAGMTGWIDWEQDRAHVARQVATMAGALSRGSVQQLVMESGDQPQLVLDGVPTNVQVLSRELGLGIPPKNSPTAVLLAAYNRWGEAFFERLDGAFAIAVWDPAAERLLLARDRLGVKPLFYAVRGQGLLFASELKGLLAHPAVHAVLDTNGLAEILVMGPNRTQGNGVFRDVREVRAGEAVVWDRGGLRPRTYWQLRAVIHRDSAAETAARVRELLAGAVHGQLQAACFEPQAAPVASMLSGGLDSTAIVALALATRPTDAAPLVSFSIEHFDSAAHFRADTFQPDADGPWVARAAAYYETDHRTVTVKPEAMAAGLEQAMAARDLPGMADVDVALQIFCHEISQVTSAVLSGEGADELFGGYPWFFREQTPHMFPWLTHLDMRWELLHPDVRRQCRPEEYLRSTYEKALAYAPQLEGETGEEAQKRELTWLNLVSWGPVLIDRSDRMGRSTGVTVLLPFCDHHLVEYVFNVPWSLKAAGGEAKSLLRQAMADLLPPDLLHRRKSPFPKTHNPAYLEAVRQRLLERLAQPSCPLHDLLDTARLRQLAANPGELQLPWFGQLMRLPQLFAYYVQLDLWLETYRVGLP